MAGAVSRRLCTQLPRPHRGHKFAIRCARLYMDPSARRGNGMGLANRTSVRPWYSGPMSPDGTSRRAHRSPRRRDVREASSEAVREPPRPDPGCRPSRRRRRNHHLPPLVARAGRRKPTTQTKVSHRAIGGRPLSLCFVRLHHRTHPRATSTLERPLEANDDSLPGPGLESPSRVAVADDEWPAESRHERGLVQPAATPRQIDIEPSTRA